MDNNDTGCFVFWNEILEKRKQKKITTEKKQKKLKFFEIFEIILYHENKNKEIVCHQAVEFLILRIFSNIDCWWWWRHELNDANCVEMANTRWLSIIWIITNELCVCVERLKYWFCWQNNMAKNESRKRKQKTEIKTKLNWLVDIGQKTLDKIVFLISFR